ncbi:ABC transporter ATP-binding protein [uncultured Ellagibacter sp.]|uniref:ATP-binding cassette domain-containing protein n=1 Tax=uncultured Ellagibacter sp. TaxID=2137580 RepID=UPI0025F1B350|nr:ABC transporter ATP-binding protein [uncultured Ellagibacter sp.]
MKRTCEPLYSSCAARDGLGVLAHHTACEGNEPAAPLVRVRKFTLRLGAFTSLEDVSFDIAKGKVTALCGPRGCGIEAMLDALGATLPGARTVDMGGSIELCGHDAYRTLGAERAREKVARVFFGGSFELQSVRNAIAFSIRQRGIHDRAAIAAEIDRVLRSLDAERRLGDHLDRAVSSLPALERRLVAIARALAKRPLVLLVSEPATGLDQVDSFTMSQALQSVARKTECAVVLATSDPRFARICADEGVALVQGRTVEAGPLPQLSSASADYRTRAFFEGRIA